MNHRPHFTRRSFIKTLGTTAIAAPFITRGLMAQSPGRVLRHASFGAGGMAWADILQFAHCDGVEVVAVCDVDLNQTADARAQFPGVKVYQDWRELLDREANNLDTVNVSTPDHMHAPIAVSAMQLGKHVYCQKPLAHDLHEVRRMTGLARKEKTVTQMGIQIHSTGMNRVGVRLVQSGIIGRIREVHSWCPKSWGDPSPRPATSDAVPAHLDWNQWLGVCADRPFIGGEYYHPGNWRKRLDFGTGTLGDMGCHIFDPVFEALNLGAPLSVRSEGPAPNAWNWAVDGKIHYRFGGTNRTDGILPVTWYDGAARPPADMVALLEGTELPDTGSIFVGTHGVLLFPHMEQPVLYPSADFRDFPYPRVQSINHWEEFIQSCRGEGRTSTDFDYSGPLTEAILIGGIASHFPNTTLMWNAEQLRFNLREANRFIRRDYRKGWRVPGLS